MKNRNESRKIVKEVIALTEKDLVTTYLEDEAEKSIQLPYTSIVAFFMADVYDRLEKIEKKKKKRPSVSKII